MLVATFSAVTAWSGRRITREQDHFVLEGFGVISAAQVLEYDRATPLVWSAGGTRAWVRSVAHREGAPVGLATAAGAVAGDASGAAASPSAARRPDGAPSVSSATSDSAQPGAGRAGPSAGASAGAQSGSASQHAARRLERRFPRAHYVGGQPSLGPSLDGTMLVTTVAVTVSGGAGAPGPSVSFTEVVRVSLYAAQVLARSGLTTSMSADGRTLGERTAEDRTFLVAHLRPRGYEAFALDGRAPEDVRRALAPVLAEAGVLLEGCAPSGRPSPVTDEVQRLAELHAQGSLSDDEFRAALGPVFTGTAAMGAPERPAAGVPGRVPDAAKEAALDRLSQLRRAGAITDAELAAMRAKLLE